MRMLYRQPSVYLLSFVIGFLSLIHSTPSSADPLDNWTSRTSGTTERLYSVTYGNSTFVAVGRSFVGGVGTILTSTKGAVWTQQTSGTDNDLQGVTYGGGTFVAVGVAGTILTSTNGTFWTPQASRTSEWLWGVTYGGGTFVAVGEFGTILTSTNATFWTPRTSGTSVDLWGVTYGGGTFVAVGKLDLGGFGTILTSTDGVSWTSRSSGTTDELLGVTYGDSTFVAVGGAGTVLTSSDGADWTERSSGTFIELFGVTYGNSTFVAVGDGGTILQSDARLTGIHSELICPSSVSTGTNLSVRVDLENRFCTRYKITRFNKLLIGNPGGTIGGLLSGIGGWGPFQTWKTVTIPAATCPSGWPESPGTASVWMSVINPVPSSLANTMAIAVVEAITDGGVEITRAECKGWVK
jgi:hypothetical protein